VQRNLQPNSGHLGRCGEIPIVLHQQGDRIRINPDVDVGSSSLGMAHRIAEHFDQQCAQYLAS
jgi:hypothetical protein